MVSLVQQPYIPRPADLQSIAIARLAETVKAKIECSSEAPEENCIFSEQELNIALLPAAPARSLR